MMIRYYILLAVALCCIHTAVAQNEDTNNDANVTPTNAAKAKFQINDIKGRGIIVRLKTNKDRIAAYRSEGYKKAADKLEKSSKAKINLLMYAFITSWTYSPVYFMESQHTEKLLEKDTLIAKTFDLQRDTAIYMNHDSFYIADFGEELRANDPDEKNPLKHSTQSTNPIAGIYWVVKDHHQIQLQPPMPCNAKVWLDEFTNTDKLNTIDIPNDLIDSMKLYLTKYKTTSELMKSESKGTAKKFMDSVYYHITFEAKKISAAVQSNSAFGDSRFSPSALGFSILGLQLVFVKGNPFQNGAKRLNKSFIAYYCKRLDKDRNILCNDDPYYWWQRNPNIPYLPYLKNLEESMKQILDSDPKFTAPH